MEDYKGYKLNYYPQPKWDNRYQTFKARPYDDADYYWAYSYDKENWKIIYKGKIIEHYRGTFEQVIDIIEDKNKDIKPWIIHW